MKAANTKRHHIRGRGGDLIFHFFFSVQNVKCPHRENSQFLTYGPYEFRLMYIRIKADYLGLEHMYNPIN